MAKLVLNNKIIIWRSSLELKKIVDPIQLFKKWLSEAEEKEIRDPNAMQLATVSKDGMPSVRTVLLKDIIDGDFVFYTNYESRKSKEIIQTGKGAICFYWKSLNRQVRLVGNLEKFLTKCPINIINLGQKVVELVPGPQNNQEN